MNNVIPLKPKHEWTWHRDRIVAAWGKHVESIITVGQCLLDAKVDLRHGAFMPMIRTELPFGQSAANMLMKIAEHPILSKCEFVHTLPAKWPVLYELTKLPHDMLLAKLKDGSINPKTTRKELLPMTQKPKKEKIKKTDKSEKPEKPKLMTVDEMCEQATAQWLSAPKNERMRIINKLMRSLGLNIHDWISSFPLNTKRRK